MCVLRFCVCFFFGTGLTVLVVSFSRYTHTHLYTWGLPDSSVGKESACNAGDAGLILESWRSAGEGIGYPLQYSWVSLVAQLVKNSACNAGDLGLIPGLGRSTGEGNWLPTPVFWSGSQRVRHDWATCTFIYIYVYAGNVNVNQSDIWSLKKVVSGNVETQPLYSAFRNPQINGILCTYLFPMC